MGFGSDPIPGMSSPDAPPIDSLQSQPESVVLRVVNGPRAGSEFRLNALRMRVGRDDPPAHRVDIDLTDCELAAVPSISRRHAELRWVDGQLELIDLGSSNGTDLNGVRLPSITMNPCAPAIVRIGDRIRFANLECEIVLNSPSR